MATPSYAYVIDQINTFIVANGNNEITANVLNPILEIITDFANNHMGDLDNLTTDETDTLVDAINSLKQNINDIVGNSVQLHIGNANPNDVPPSTYNYGDFFMQLSPLDNEPIQLWQFNGFEWFAPDAATSWGDIEGNIADQTDLQGALDLKADITDLEDYQLLSEKGEANGYTPLDSDSKVPLTHLPNILQDKKWVIFGDSLSATLEDPNYTYYAIQKLGVKDTVTHGVPGHRLYQQVSVLEGLLLANPNYFDNYDISSLMIGINDFLNNITLGNLLSPVGDSTFAGQLKLFLQIIYTAKPNIKMYVISPIEIDYATSPYRAINHNGDSLSDFAGILKQIASWYAVQFVDLNNMSGFNEQTISSLTWDGIHPITAGGKILGNLVADAFLANNNTPSRSVSLYKNEMIFGNKAFQNAVSAKQDISSDGVVSGKTGLGTDIYTVSTLPFPYASRLLYVTDAKDPKPFLNVIGGGTAKCYVVGDGTNWKCINGDTFGDNYFYGNIKLAETKQVNFSLMSYIAGAGGNTYWDILNGDLIFRNNISEILARLNGDGKFISLNTITAAPATLSTELVTKGQLDAAARPYKVYTALISQSGTNAPTAIVLENTLGGTVVWSRNSTGQYYGTLSGAFPANKVAILATSGSIHDSFKLSGGRVNDNIVVIISNNSSGAQSDSGISGATVEIRVYP